jgi:superfamily I DNA/RNA helicase
MAVLSDEQQAIIKSKAKRKVVYARAGTGKTTTVMSYAKNRHDKKVLYIVYNKSMSSEFERKMASWKLDNVEARTVHSLAFSRSELTKRTKVVNFIAYSDFKEIIGRNVQFEHYRKVMDGLAMFCNSTLENINEVELSPFVARELLREFWQKIVTGNSPITHDVYLKHYALSHPDLSDEYDLVMLDEAQDANPVMAQLLEHLTCELVIVGDPEQQIYSWRGAKNIMRTFDGEIFSLSKSWRFNHEIADFANQFLGYKDSSPKLSGIDRPAIHYAPPAHICRTVAGAIEYARNVFDEDPTKQIIWNGGIESYRLADVLDVWHLRHSRYELIRNKKLLKDFSDWDSYQTGADNANDYSMRWNIKLIEDSIKQGENLADIIKQLERNALQKQGKPDPENSIIITTAHRSKGLEFPSISIQNDFVNVIDDMQQVYENLNSSNPTKHQKGCADFDRLDEEVNLMYVTITRTQTFFDNRSNAINHLLSFGNKPKNRDIYKACKELRYN